MLFIVYLKMVIQFAVGIWIYGVFLPGWNNKDKKRRTSFSHLIWPFRLRVGCGYCLPRISRETNIPREFRPR